MKTLRSALALATCLALASGAWAQTTLIAQKTLTLDGANKIIAAAMNFIKKNNTTGVIAVVDAGGNLISLQRTDNTFPAGAAISIGKARTAALFQKPTKVFEEIITKGRTPMIALNDFTPLQGGVPILMEGQVVGAVGVSGAANAAQDEEISETAATALSTTAPLPVTFFDQTTVAAAFARGAVLFDGNGNRNYMIHASRREKPGQVEVHTQDTDLIYVQGGSCTFVTGGTMVGGKNIAPDEIRGTGIQGGEARQLTKGDVIIVPAGVPHWFQKVDAPFTYYVIKVR